MDRLLKLLLDTNVILWSALEPRKLSNLARELLEDTQTQRVVSTVSIWEICIKYASKKLELDCSPHEFMDLVRTNLLATTLSLSSKHAIGVCDLPDIHRDPFDRMLVCQAIVHDLTIVTPDPEVRSYPVKSIW